MKGWLTALAVAVVAIPAPAHAEDHRPCVSKIEYGSAGGLITHRGGVTRHELETRWDAHPQGIVDIPVLGRAQQYRRCGYSLKEAWVAAQYNRDGTVYSIALWKSQSATLHGRP